MKKTFFTILLIFVSLMSYSQLSDNVKKLTDKILIIDTIPIVEKFNSGEIKETYTKLIYQIGNNQYEGYSGLHRFYLKDSTVFLQYEYDNFGFLIRELRFNKNGEIYYDYEVLEIDTNSDSLDNFFSKGNFQITSYEKNYVLDGNNITRIDNEGKRKNGKRIGTWKFYKFDKDCKLYIQEKKY